ncbi:MAG: hypothetical protein ACRCZJ_08835 [Erysipelotrichaceae bacterium]
MEQKCPVCPRACDINALRCMRGEEYKRTGVIPVKQKGRFQFENQEKGKVMKYLHHVIREVDYPGFTQANADDMFDILTNDEISVLAELLQRMDDRCKGKK